MVATKKKADFSIRTTNFQVNRLLNRRQFVVELSHAGWCGTVPTKLVRKKLAQLYKVSDEETISVFGMKTKFGGGKTTAFGLIYDDLASLKRTEPTYRRLRLGLCEKKNGNPRRGKKDRRKRNKKLRGTAKK